ncbi:MAG: hypothetical protein APR63_11875 [Desulfuromonas sp. SDB]|nr:MAG: hypothetical protein APR63_11875 [Desulfuromonas sp. SDB]
MKNHFYINCSKCKKFGLEFRSKHNITPLDFIEGDIKSDIWIIGLNPKNKVGYIEDRNKKDFQIFNPNRHPYFKSFKKMSKKLYENWESKNNYIAHTDLVKCFSNSFPPKIKNNSGKKSERINNIVENCFEILKKQIYEGKPKLIICNGSPVSKIMIENFPPKQNNIDEEVLTSYKTEIIINNVKHNIWIVLSGFIGRIDDRNKRRLGIEIEEILKKEKICI